jgi:hypothetical protein
MKTFKLSILMVMGLLALALHAEAQRPFQYFAAGQFMEYTNNINNLKDFSPDGIKAEFASGRQLFVQAGATPEVLASYDSIVKTSLGLPLFRNYSNWTQAQQDKWNKSEMDAGALDKWLGTNPDTKACFFFWLGNKTAVVGKTAPSEFDWGASLSQAQALAAPALQKFVTFRDDCPTTFKTLRPQVQNAVKAIATYSQQGNNLSQDDINAIQKKAAIIVQFASNHNLTQ